MPKKSILTFVIIIFIVFLFSGCSKDDGTTSTITLIAVPTEATIPNGLHLNSVLSVTNPIPDNPDGATTTTQLGVFGFTNIAGEPVYYIYGKKESVANGQSHLIDKGFYQVKYSIDPQNVVISIKDSGSPLTKVDGGKGASSVFAGELPFAFYTPVDEKPGLYSFVDVTGATHFRVYATFLEKNGNFFPATEDGQMVPGSLPIDKVSEETLQSQGSGAVSKLITTPIGCSNVPITFSV